MTSAIQYITPVPREQRDQALILLDKREERTLLQLHAYYQKRRFPDHFVRVFKVPPHETASTFIYRKSLHRVLNSNSYVVIYNGVTNTVEHLASVFLEQIAKQAEKRSVIPPVILRRPVSLSCVDLNTVGHVAWSQSGMIVTRYIRSAIHWGLWKNFYSQDILSKRIYTHFCDWFRTPQAKSDSGEQPPPQSRVITILHVLLPNVDCIKQSPSTQRFPSEEHIAQQWQVTEIEIEKHRPLDRESSGLKRKADALQTVDLSASFKRQKFGAHFALTPQGRWVAAYIKHCIENNLWTSFYAKIGQNSCLYTHYRQLAETNAFGGITGKYMFMRTMYGVLPVIYPVGGHRARRHYFPSKDVIEKQWTKAQQEIAVWPQTLHE